MLSYTNQQKETISLLDLSPDLLRACAFWLRPRDRLSFATTCKYLFTHIWASDVIPDLTDRFPVEHRVRFPLHVSLDDYQQQTSITTSSSINPQQPCQHCTQTPSNQTPSSPSQNSPNQDNSTNPSSPSTPSPSSPSSPSSPPPPMRLRMVPNRSRQQHVNIAVSSTGTLVAVLPYDNYLRILSVTHRRILSCTKLPSVFYSDVWEVIGGRRRARTRPGHAIYADEAGLDVENSLEFSSDDSLVLISAPTRLSLYTILRNGRRLEHNLSLRLETAVAVICQSTGRSHTVQKAAAGAAALSPDKSRLAWVIFAGHPVFVYITFWDLKESIPKCTGVCAVANVSPRGWSTLRWARVAWTPAGAHCISVVKTANNMMGIRHVSNSNDSPTPLSMQRARLCQYELAVFETRALSNGHQCSITPLRSRTAWLALECDIYTKELSRAIAALLHGLRIHITRHAYGVERVELSRKAQLRSNGISMNSMHSCPAEATYKAMSFTQGSTRPWLVTKQPLYSLHFSMDGERILVATSPHENRMINLARNGVHAQADLIEIDDEDEEKRWMGNRRKHAFNLMPWRRGFATVTAFSASGKWLAGVSLLDNDQCCVCLRNVTMTEYFS